jgi:hypothetical protein
MKPTNLRKDHSDPLQPIRKDGRQAEPRLSGDLIPTLQYYLCHRSRNTTPWWSGPRGGAEQQGAQNDSMTIQLKLTRNTPTLSSLPFWAQTLALHQSLSIMSMRLINNFPWS